MHAPMARISPNKKVEDDKNGMFFLKYSKMSLAVFNGMKIQICLIKLIKYKDSLATCQIFFQTSSKVFLVSNIFLVK